MEKETHYPFFVAQTKEISRFFEEWHHSKTNEYIEMDGDPMKESPYSRLHDAFDEYHRKKANNPDLYFHNCIGCNLAGSANMIRYFLKTNQNCDYVGYYIKMYSLLFYTHVENLAVIYQELGYVTNKGDFDWESFPTFQMIKYWAEFF